MAGQRLVDVVKAEEAARSTRVWQTWTVRIAIRIH